MSSAHAGNARESARVNSWNKSAQPQKPVHCMSLRLCLQWDVLYWETIVFSPNAGCKSNHETRRPPQPAKPGNVASSRKPAGQPGRFFRWDGQPAIHQPQVRHRPSMHVHVFSKFLKPIMKALSELWCCRGNSVADVKEVKKLECLPMLRALVASG